MIWCSLSVPRASSFWRLASAAVRLLISADISVPALQALTRTLESADNLIWLALRNSATAAEQT